MWEARGVREGGRRGQTGWRGMNRSLRQILGTAARSPQPSTERQRGGFQSDSDRCRDRADVWGEAFPGAAPVRGPEGCWPVLGNLSAVDGAAPVEAPPRRAGAWGEGSWESGTPQTAELHGFQF